MRTFSRIISASASIISALYADISRSNLRKAPEKGAQLANSLKVRAHYVGDPTNLGEVPEVISG
jgi:hypothetical protein